MLVAESHCVGSPSVTITPIIFRPGRWLLRVYCTIPSAAPSVGVLPPGFATFSAASELGERAREESEAEHWGCESAVQSLPEKNWSATPIPAEVGAEKKP